MNYLYMNEQGQQVQYYQFPKISAGITVKSECENYLYAAV